VVRVVLVEAEWPISLPKWHFASFAHVQYSTVLAPKVFELVDSVLEDSGPNEVYALVQQQVLVVLGLVALGLVALGLVAPLLGLESHQQAQAALPDVPCCLAVSVVTVLDGAVDMSWRHVAPLEPTPVDFLIDQCELYDLHQTLVPLVSLVPLDERCVEVGCQKDSELAYLHPILAFLASVSTQAADFAFAPAVHLDLFAEEQHHVDVEHS